MLVFRNKQVNQPLELDFGTTAVRLAPLETREVDLPASYLALQPVLFAQAEGSLVAYVKFDPAPEVVETSEAEPEQATEATEAPTTGRTKRKP